VPNGGTLDENYDAFGNIVMFTDSSK